MYFLLASNTYSDVRFVSAITHHPILLAFSQYLSIIYTCLNICCISSYRYGYKLLSQKSKNSVKNSMLCACTMEVFLYVYSARLFMYYNFSYPSSFSRLVSYSMYYVNSYVIVAGLIDKKVCSYNIERKYRV